jgi:putative heme iron utilization protein
MTADPLTDAVSERICSHMNRDHAEAVLAYARHFGDRPEAREATMLAVRPEGMELSADGETLVVPFDHQLSDSEDAHRTLVAMLRSLPRPN